MFSKLETYSLTVEFRDVVRIYVEIENGIITETVTNRPVDWVLVVVNCEVECII